MNFGKPRGGFYLLAIERSEPLHIQFLLRQKHGHTRAIGDLVIRSAKPLETRYFALRALPPGVAPTAVTLNSALRRRVIRDVARDLTRFYVSTEVASKMVVALHARQKDGAYQRITDGYLFAERLTADLRAVSHDKHLLITFSPFKIPRRRLTMCLNIARGRARITRRNCGFDKVEVLPHDIGYIKFDAFMPPRICGRVASAAMASVAHTKAVIFDLRDKHGGTPEMVDYMASYLFDHRTQLNDVVNRYQGTITRSWTRPHVPGRRMPTQPVFVLTSKHTFSAAEGFCYAVQNLKRATIVGETTEGGAHLVRAHAVAGYFIARVPDAEAVSPITHTNWEGTGVRPNVRVPAAEALRTAEDLALKDIDAATVVK